MVFWFSVFSEFDVDSFTKMQIFPFALVFSVLWAEVRGITVAPPKWAFPFSFTTFELWLCLPRNQQHCHCQVLMAPSLSGDIVTNEGKKGGGTSF